MHIWRYGPDCGYVSNGFVDIDVYMLKIDGVLAWRIVGIVSDVRHNCGRNTNGCLECKQRDGDINMWNKKLEHFRDDG